jgi:RNA polymerase sigma-70 factor, ECF subfamily
MRRPGRQPTGIAGLCMTVDRMRPARGVEADWNELMRAALAGDELAYQRLLASLAGVLRGVVRRGLSRGPSGDGDVEDIVQEALLAIHLKRHTWLPTEPLAPWVFAIVRNKMIDAMRRRRRRVEVPIELHIDHLESEPEAGTLDRRDIDTLLASLDPRARDIVRLISLEGCSSREVGDKLGMTEGAVRVALHRGLKALAAAYRKSEGNGE